ncbi:hypothetical protein X798_01113, partial [Onchocerca flexuosa]
FQCGCVRGGDWVCVLGSPRGFDFSDIHSRAPAGNFEMGRKRGHPNAIDLPQQTAESKEIIYENMKISSEIRSDEPKIPSVSDVLITSTTQNIELENEHDRNGNHAISKSSTVKEICYGFDQKYLFPQRSETSLSVRSDLYNVRKPYNSRVKETNADPLWGSCFELHPDFDEFQNQNIDGSKNTAPSPKILHNKESSDPDITQISNMSGQKLVSASNEHFCIGVNLYRIYFYGVMQSGLHNGVYRASDDCLATVCGEACVNSHFVPRWRSLSLSAQNFNHAAILTKSEHMNTAVNEKVVSISENDLSTSDTRFSSKYSHNNSPEILLIASEHQKRTPKNSHDCISLTEQSSNLLLSSVHSNKSFNDSVSWGNITPSVDLHISVSSGNDITTEEDIPLTYMMLNTDHNPGCDFNQTQIKREEYVKDKANVEQNIKVELSKDDLKKNCFVTQHTIIYPVSHLEMQCFPNNTYEFKYEDAKDRKDGDTQTAILHRDQYSQTKELIVTQSAEDMNRAVSVLNIMLQRRLNNGGNQNGSFTQEGLNSFYSTPPGRPKSPQKILNFQSFAKTNELNDFVDKSDAPLSNSKHLSIEPELFKIKKKTAVVAKQQYGYIESKENLLRRYCHENSCEKTSQKSGSDGRSTIRDRLPRGQTRKLASLFETMSDAANVEMLQEIDHLKRRGKSVPPNIINKTCHREPEVNIRERFRDLTIPCKRNGFEEQFVRDKRIVQSSVRSIVNRFESVSAPNKYQSSPRTLQVDITPQKPIHQKQYSQSSSPRSDEWNEYVSRGNPSYNLPHDITSCANVWDQQQYELGLHKGITSLKRYDSSYSRLPNEFLSRDPSYTLQTHIRQMNYSPEIQSNYHMAVITDEKHSYEKKLDSEIVDHVAEVEKAFDFVNKISLYHDLEREYRKSPNGDIPARFSPIVYSPLPSIGEQLTTYEHKNPIMKSAKLGTHMITTDPMATSTPLDDSPAANSRMHTSASYMSNRSGISSITASTAQEIIQLQQSDIGLQTIKQEIMIQEGQIAQASEQNYLYLDVSYAFVILLKTDEQVEATQTVTLMDTRALRVSKVHFPDQIRFTNLPVDFKVLLEIYALKISENRRSDDYSCSMLKNKAKSLLSPSKKTCCNESIVGSSEFTCCGHICLNRDTIGMQKFYLDGAVYPLEGTIEIESRCTTLPPTIEIDFRGFLTMYQIIAGLGSWARYWAVLRCGVVQFWKYPDDEISEKPALACMDLSKCTDKEIGHAPHEICSRPNAFTVDLLVPKSASLIEKKRFAYQCAVICRHEGALQCLVECPEWDTGGTSRIVMICLKQDLL